MEGADICFVHLGIAIQSLRNSISVFGFRIAFYGIIIGIGMLAGLMVAQADARRRGQDPEVYLDFALYGIIFSIMGARTYYVIFEWDYYKENILQILNLRAGGLAIYGGVIAAVVTLIVFCRVRKLSFFSIADSCVLGLVTGQIIGRWGNFFNCEAFGGYTDSLLAMRIKLSLVNPGMLNEDVLSHLITEQGVQYIQVHPTFLYESLWNLGLLCFMLWYCRRKRFDGEMLAIYLLGYGMGRFWIEGLRTDQLILFQTGIPVSQALSAALVLAALAALVLHGRRGRKTDEGGQPDGDQKGRTGGKD